MTGKGQSAVVRQGEARVVGDLPEMTIRIRGVPGVAAVGRLAGWAGDSASGPLGSTDDLLNLSRNPPGESAAERRDGTRTCRSGAWSPLSACGILSAR